LLDERALREQTAHAESAQAMVQRAVTRINSARFGIAQVNVELRRNEQLAKDGFIAPVRMETDRLAERAARKEVDSAIEEHQMAQHDLEQARAAPDVLRQPGSAASARAFELRAPVAGHVLRVLQPSEATVAMGTPVMELGDMGRLEVVAQLLSADAMQAPPGYAGAHRAVGRPGGIGGHITAKASARRSGAPDGTRRFARPSRPAAATTGPACAKRGSQASCPSTRMLPGRESAALGSSLCAATNMQTVIRRGNILAF
jgi:hypothetical protein